MNFFPLLYTQINLVDGYKFLCKFIIFIEFFQQYVLSRSNLNKVRKEGKQLQNSAHTLSLSFPLSLFSSLSFQMYNVGNHISFKVIKSIKYSHQFYAHFLFSNFILLFLVNRMSVFFSNYKGQRPPSIYKKKSNVQLYFH